MRLVDRMIASHMSLGLLTIPTRYHIFISKFGARQMVLNNLEPKANHMNRTGLYSTSSPSAFERYEEKHNRNDKLKLPAMGISGFLMQQRSEPHRCRVFEINTCEAMKHTWLKDTNHRRLCNRREA